MKGVFKHCDHVTVSRKTNIIILSLICLILCSLALIILLFNTKNIFRYIDIFRFKCNICLLDFNGYTRLEFFFFFIWLANEVKPQLCSVEPRYCGGVRISDLLTTVLERQ